MDKLFFWPDGGAKRKVKVIIIHPEGDVIVSTKFHDNPSNSFFVWINYLTDITVHKKNYLPNFNLPAFHVYYSFKKHQHLHPVLSPFPPFSFVFCEVTSLTTLNRTLS